MADSNRDLENDQQIDRIADLFEMACRKKQSPSIEEFLAKADEGFRQKLFVELLEIELELAMEIGAQLKESDYLLRFPDYSRVIRERFDPGKSTIQFNAPSDAEAIPTKVDRYDVLKILGKGSFGSVYKAYDPQLERDVALKVPHKQFADGEKLQLYIDEAAAAARMDHPGIVNVYDCKRTQDSFVIVQQYVRGRSLAELLEEKHLSPVESAKMLLQISEAISYAHGCNIVHRDIKPANILVTESLQPLVADFGLALREEFQHRQRGQRAGSPAYMSPEQVQALTHWLDGRTDIWSLGVMFYEMLTRRRPFRGRGIDQLFEEIRERDPKPPRMIDQGIPSELERICLKCLEKRLRDRYATADDLADDLREFVAALQNEQTHEKPGEDERNLPSREPRRLQVVPKGLRAFTSEDAEFFLDLLEGPRNRFGLPESISFWKRRIDPGESADHFPVGVLYGPSGCGKSSFVRAGLIPVLDDSLEIVFVAAPGTDLGDSLLLQLQKRIPEVSSEWDLERTLFEVRNGLLGSNKMLIVVDQFEQWLHTGFREDSESIVDAIKHCDGNNLQALFVARSDFWMSVARFARLIETPLVDGENIAAVDLFSSRHAKKIMSRLGVAYGALEETGATEAQEMFITKAIDSLADDHLIVCVKLVLYLEMIKSRPWQLLDSDDEIQVEKLGVQYFESTFAGPTSNPTYRLHSKGAQAVLAQLLPEAESNLKGRGRTLDELQAAANYEDRKSMDELIRILDLELRLITPVDEDQNRESATQKTYALTHDYLVVPLRQWLTLKETESASGRARLTLANRSAQWNFAQQNRNLPSLPEYVRIRALTRKRQWSEEQSSMMSKADRYFGSRAFATCLVLALCSFVGASFFSSIQEQRADLAVQRAVTVPPQAFPSVSPLVMSYSQRAIPTLQHLAIESQRTKERTRARILLISLIDDDVSSVSGLINEIEMIDLPELANIVGAVQGDTNVFVEEVEKVEPQLSDLAAARLAYISLVVGKLDLFSGLVETTGRQALFISLLDEWPDGIPDTIAAFTSLNINEIISHQSAFRLAIYAFGFHADKVLDTEQQKLVAQLQNVFESKETIASVHSIAMWCLRILGAPPATADSYRAGIGWQEVGDGMTMITIPEGEIERFGKTIKVDSFLCSNSEVCEPLFALFEEETEIRRGGDGGLRGIQKRAKHQPATSESTLQRTEIRELSPIFFPRREAPKEVNIELQPLPSREPSAAVKTNVVFVQTEKANESPNAAAEQKNSNSQILESPSLPPPPMIFQENQGTNFKLPSDSDDIRSSPFEDEEQANADVDILELPEPARRESLSTFGSIRGSIGSRAGAISYPLIMDFCNWLSVRHDLRPCYKFNELGDPDSEFGMTKDWYLNTTANGYRLPSVVEFAYLKQPIAFPILNSESKTVQDRFACLFRTKRAAFEVAPDSRGMFDVLGSYWEWCEPIQMAPAFENAPKVLMGGSRRSADLPEAFTNRLVRPAESTFLEFGIRLVRSIGVSFDDGQWTKIYSSNPGWQNAVMMAEAEEFSSLSVNGRVPDELDGIRRVVRVALDQGSFNIARTQLVEALKQIIPNSQLRVKIDQEFSQSGGDSDEVASFIYWQSLELALKEHYASLEERSVYTDNIANDTGELSDLLDKLLRVERRSAQSYSTAVEAALTIAASHDFDSTETQSLVDALKSYLRTKQARTSYHSAMDLWKVAQARSQLGVNPPETEIQARAGVRAARREYILAEHGHQLALQKLLSQDSN